MAVISRRQLLGSLGAAALTGCGRTGSRPLSLWALGYEGDYSPLLMPDFTARTGIAVEVQSLPWTAAHEKLLTALAGHSLPDLMMLPITWVEEFAMIGALAPLTDARLFDDLVPGVRAGVRRGGRDYAVPWSVAPQMQFYRSDLLGAVDADPAPTDWAGWRAMGLKLKRRFPDSFAFLTLLNWWDTLFTFAGQIGVPLLRDRDTRGNFNTPEFAATLDFYHSLFIDRLAPAVLSTEVQDPVASFAQGWFAVYPSAPTLLLELRRRAPEIPRAKWSVARMPGPAGPASVSSVSGALAMSSRTARQDETLALLRHLTSADSELRLQQLIGNLPARASAWRAPQLAQAALRPMAAQVADPGSDPRIVEWERIRLEVQLVAERLVRGDVALRPALAEMDRRVDLILARRRVLVERGRIA